MSIPPSLSPPPALFVPMGLPLRPALSTTIPAVPRAATKEEEKRRDVSAIGDRDLYLGVKTFFAKTRMAASCDADAADGGSMPRRPAAAIIGRFQRLKYLHHPNLCEYIDIVRGRQVGGAMPCVRRRMVPTYLIVVANGIL